MKTSSVEYACGDISISLPMTLEDHCVYSFEDAPEKLTVEYEPLSKKIQPSNLIQNIKKRLARVMGTTAIYTEYPVQSKAFSFSVLSIENSGGKFYLYNACFRRSDSLMATITFQTVNPDSKSILDHILNSVANLHNGSLASPGYVVQSAGLIQLHVPNKMKSNSHWRFVIADEHVQIRISDDKPELTQYVTDNTGIKGDLVKTNDTPPFSNKIISHVESFKGTIKTSNPIEEKWFKTAEITTKSGNTFFF